MHQTPIANCPVRLLRHSLTQDAHRYTVTLHTADLLLSRRSRRETYLSQIDTPKLYLSSVYARPLKRDLSARQSRSACARTCVTCTTRLSSGQHSAGSGRVWAKPGTAREARSGSNGRQHTRPTRRPLKRGLSARWSRSARPRTCRTTEATSVPSTAARLGRRWAGFSAGSASWSIMFEWPAAHASGGSRSATQSTAA